MGQDLRVSSVVAHPFVRRRNGCTSSTECCVYGSTQPRPVQIRQCRAAGVVLASPQLIQCPKGEFRAAGEPAELNGCTAGALLLRRGGGPSTRCSRYWGAAESRLVWVLPVLSLSPSSSLSEGLRFEDAAWYRGIKAYPVGAGWPSVAPTSGPYP